MDGSGRVLAGSRRLPDYQSSNVRKSSSRVFNEEISSLRRAGGLHYEGTNKIDGFSAWQKLKQISENIDKGGPSLM